MISKLLLTYTYEEVSMVCPGNKTDFQHEITPALLVESRELKQHADTDNNNVKKQLLLRPKQLLCTYITLLIHISLTSTALLRRETI